MYLGMHGGLQSLNATPSSYNREAICALKFPVIGVFKSFAVKMPFSRTESSFWHRPCVGFKTIHYGKRFSRYNV